MLRILTVLCLVGASFAHGGAEAMMKKYAYSKIMSSCFGEETVMQYKIEMKAAADVCKGQDVTQTIVNIREMLKEMTKRFSPFIRQNQQQPLYVPMPMYYPQFQPNSFRTKRSIDLSPEGIERMRANMMAKISNMTCIMKELNYIDANNQPNYAYFNEEVNKLTVDEGLKEDLREAMDMCRDFAMCMPVEKAKHPIKKEFGTTAAFMKCCHMAKAKVCMKHDLKKYAPMMGFEGDVATEEGEQIIDEIHTFLTEGGDMMM